MTLRIIGAGMAGLLAANMLRHRDPVVLEAQTELPNNHSAVLRFSSRVVSDVLGIPFKKVNLIKDTIPWKNPVADALAYSYKCHGEYRSDRSVSLPQRAATSERWIAPANLIELMANRVPVFLNKNFDFLTVSGHPEHKVISTIPMPALLSAMGGCPVAPNFRYVTGHNIRATVADCDAYVSLLVPAPDLRFSRVSLTGDELIVEVPQLPGQMSVSQDGAEYLADEAADLLGLEVVEDSVTVHRSTYAKILPIDEDQRRNAIHWASSVRGVAWQLGRFATWRPGLLLDDLVNDVRRIDGWIGSQSAGYEMDMRR